MRTFNDLNSAYLGVLEDVYLNPEYFPCPHGSRLEKGYIPNGGETREILNYQFRILNTDLVDFKTHNIQRNDILNRHMLKEIELFDAGIIDADIMGQHSALWKRIANPDNTINANYGYMAYHNKTAGNPKFNDDQGLVSQWEWA